MRDIAASGGSDPSWLTAVGANLYFVADDDALISREVWMSNATTTTVVRDINPVGGSSPNDLAAVGETLYFNADDGTHGRELWMSDSTTTTMVRDINPLVDPSSPWGFFAWNDSVYFNADDGEHGSELWKTDATTTTMVRDINPAGNSSPEGFVAMGGALYFKAEDSTGWGLWKMTVASSGSGNNSDNNTGNITPSANPLAADCQVVAASTKAEVKFAGKSRKLSTKARDAIRKKIQCFESVKTVVCTGYTDSSPTSAERATARARAKNTCAFTKKTSTDNNTKIQVRLSSATGNSAREVRLKVNGTKKK